MCATNAFAYLTALGSLSRFSPDNECVHTTISCPFHRTLPALVARSSLAMGEIVLQMSDVVILNMSLI